jgi:calponin homology domain-containing protein DDB_G0272472
VKKTLILLTIISSVATFSKTNGFVEAYNENEANFKKNTDATFTAKELGVKTQVNVARTNLSFGGDFKFKDLQLNNTTPKNFLNHSSVWIKYDLSKKETGINSYVKATIKPKFHAEEAETPQVRKLNKEIQQLENKKAQLTQDKEKAEKDVKEKIKDEAKVNELTAKTADDGQLKKDIDKKEKEKQEELIKKEKQERVIKESQEKINVQNDKVTAAENKLANIIEKYKNEKKQKKENELQQLEEKFKKDKKDQEDNVTKEKGTLDFLKQTENTAKLEKEKNEKKINEIDTALKPLKEEYENSKRLQEEENAKPDKNSPEAQKLNEAVTKAKAAITANNEEIAEKNAIKNEIEVYQDNGGIDLEGDLSYKTESAVFGVNSVLNVPFSNTYIKGNGEITKDFATLIKSTHTAYFGVSDVLSGGLSVQHSYKGEDAMKYVSAKLDGKYAVSNDLDLVGKFRFKYQFNGEIDFKNEYLGNKDLLSFVDTKWNVSPLTYIHMYSLGLNYRKTLNITGFVGHGYEKTKKLNYLNYGLMADVKYTGIDKLTLKANATLSGLNVGNKYIGLFEFGANAKYDFNATDKFTVSPELDANVKFKTKEKVEDVKFVVTPKVSVKYVPVNGLTLSGSVGVPVTVMNSAYESTSIKTNLNIRYEW